MEWKGSVAVVTGAGSGIGLAMVRAFARLGMKLVLVERNPDSLRDAARGVEGLGGEVLARQADVGNWDEVSALADAAFSRFGKVNVLCNNAGVSGPTKPAHLLTRDEWSAVIQVNLFGVIHGVSAFLPRMLAGGERGHVVNTASIAGFLGSSFLAPYGVSKHGVVALSESLIESLEGTNVSVSVLCPGPVATAIFSPPRDSESPEASPAEQTRQVLEQITADGMSADRVAERVIQAIIDKEPYVFTHPDYAKLVRERFERVLKAQPDK